MCSLLVLVCTLTVDFKHHLAQIYIVCNNICKTYFKCWLTCVRDIKCLKLVILVSSSLRGYFAWEPKAQEKCILYGHFKCIFNWVLGEMRSLYYIAAAYGCQWCPVFWEASGLLCLISLPGPVLLVISEIHSDLLPFWWETGRPTAGGLDLVTRTAGIREPSWRDSGTEQFPRWSQVMLSTDLSHTSLWDSAAVKFHLHLNPGEITVWKPL